jgi:two-component system, OmpR family, sensor histidine kinase VicK
VKNTRVDIVKKISLVYEQLQRSFKRRKFTFVSADPSLFINTDIVKVLQVINNFTSNAVKFSPESREITIRVQSTESEVIISVSDNGIGIPEELKPYLFDEDSRAGRVGLAGERSIRMGLSGCKKITEQLSGTFWFDSREGMGSTFYMKLPKTPLRVWPPQAEGTHSKAQGLNAR